MRDPGRRRTRVLGGLRGPALALILAPGLQGGPPIPEPAASEADFLAWAREGTFDEHLELHLVAYPQPAGWLMDAAGARGTSQVLTGAFGSTASWHLATAAGFTLNLHPVPGLQLRYERRLMDDRRFSLDDERVSVLWYPGSGWALMATGWPTARKEEAGVGLGFRLGPQGAGNSLEVAFVDDGLFWNRKTLESSRFVRTPQRLIVNAYLGQGAWRLRGAFDWGSTYRFEAPLPDPTRGAQTLAGYQRLGEGAMAFDGGAWVLDTRLTLGGLLREQVEPDGATYRLSRRYGRILETLDLGRGAWRWTAWLGVAHQADDLASPSVEDGCYRMTSLILGAEAGKALSPALEARLGYLGGPRRMARTGTELGGALGEPLARTSDGYSDKVHLRLRFGSSPRLRVEALISHSIAGAQFGGAALKVQSIF